MHPLTNDLTKLTDQELSEKINALQKRVGTASRLPNTGMLQQLFMIMEDYQFEYRRRTDKQLEEVLKKSGTTMKDVLNIE